MDSKLEGSASRVIGEPNKVTSEESRRRTPGATDCSSSTKGVEDAPAMYASNLERFKESPREEDCSRIVVKSAKTDCGEPPRVPSSRYQTLNVDTSSLAKEWMARLTRMDPRGHLAAHQ